MIDPINPPKPLLCRMAGIIKEFRQEAETFKQKGNDEGHVCMWAAAERVKDECESYLTEAKAWRERPSSDQNDQDHE